MQIEVRGLASNKVWSLTYTKTDVDLMSFLIHNELPIASSCNGEGICEKCIITINGVTFKSCQISLNEVNGIVIVDYL